MTARATEVQVAKAHNALKEHLICLKLGSAVLTPAAPRPRRRPPAAAAGRRAPSSSSYSSSSSSSSAAEMGLGAPLLSAAFPTGKGMPGAAASAAQDGVLHIVAGTIHRKLAPALVRAAYRVTRGNCVVHEEAIDEPVLGVPMEAGGDVKMASSRGAEPVAVAKNFVLLVYSGAILHAKVSKICHHFGVAAYPFPEGRPQRQALQARLEVDKMEMRELLRSTRALGRAALSAIAAELGGWALAVEREKATVHSLNMISYDLTRKVFVAEGWVPTKELPHLVAAAAAARGGDTVPVIDTPRRRPHAADLPAHHPLHRGLPGARRHVRRAAVRRENRAFAVVPSPSSSPSCSATSATAPSSPSSPSSSSPTRRSSSRPTSTT